MDGQDFLIYLKDTSPSWVLYGPNYIQTRYDFTLYLFSRGTGY